MVFIAHTRKGTAVWHAVPQILEFPMHKEQPEKYNKQLK
jgi:hypothetical protein